MPFFVESRQGTIVQFVGIRPFNGFAVSGVHVLCTFQSLMFKSSGDAPLTNERFFNIVWAGLKNCPYDMILFFYEFLLDFRIMI